MNAPRIPIAEPVLGEDELANVIEAIRSGWISSKGAFIGEFEREFAAFCGAAHGVAVANGTVALHISLLAAGVGPGDEVLVPSLTFVATANAVRYCGATPVFVDSTRDTWQMDAAALEAKITRRSRAILPVHLYGHPCDMDPILRLAERRALAVVEDAAEAHGALYRGRRVGGLGNAGCFSFYGNKLITTGEGGICLTSDGVMAERLRLLRDHGMDPKRTYWHDIVGYNYRMTNLQAAVGVAQVKKLGAFIEKKRQIARWYAEALAPLAQKGLVELHPEAPWARSVFWMYSVLLAGDAISLDQVRNRLNERGVDSRPFFHPIHTLPPYATGERLPVAEDLAAHGLNLPSGVGLEQAQVERVARALAEALEA
ncbi:MAG TPA: DegT/DnrJ/EryC1/StrS family aminotransferase [Methylomirabilota bacterium]|nr:DegT/DnrJ/EryC1/StrS family aminotransferase [Methylomirabilota bacterium]